MPAATRTTTSSKTSRKGGASRSGQSTAKKPASSRSGKPAGKPAGARKGRSSSLGRAKRTTAGRRSNRSTSRRSGAMGRAITDLMERHAGDIAGVTLVAVGAVLALAVWMHAAGPLGDGLEVGTRAAVGTGAGWLPVVLAVGGITLAFTHGGRAPAVRVAGAVLAVVAVLGLTHLAGGASALDAPLADVSRGGGYVGAAMSVPLRSALGSAGAVVVLVALTLLGLLITTGRNLRSAAHAARRFWAYVVAAPPAPPVPPTAAAPVGEGAGVPMQRKRRTVDTQATSPQLQPGDEAKTAVAAKDTELYDQAGDPSEPARHAGPSSQSVPRPGARRVSRQLTLGEAPPPDAELYELPPLTLLKKSAVRRLDRAGLESRSEVIKATLDEFDVGAEVVGIVAGPTVTRFEIELAQGVKVNALLKLSPDICYALATPDVRILAPIPGRSAIGLEVPNTVRQMVTLRDILEREDSRGQGHPLAVPLGKDISGRSVLENVAEMPHLLISGATGSGKSSAINSILTSILCRSRPSEIRMILIDPKRVELGRYGRIPHLLTGVVTNPKRAADALEWAVQEMDRRYEVLQMAGSRDLVGYNEIVARGGITTADGEPAGTLPHILVVIDELADLMLISPRHVEEAVARITQMARAVGIHLVIATQRPSVNVITGVIKANIPSRMAFKVRTITDSRVILDHAGAEKLVGQGDMLYLGSQASQSERIQGCFVTEDEVTKVVAHWRKQAERVRALDVAQVEFAPSGMDVPGDLDADPTPSVGGGVLLDDNEDMYLDVVFSGDLAVASVREDDEDGDELLGRAMDLVVTSQLGSTSMLQRKLRVGFARAGRIMDLLEQRGVVGPSEGSKARKVVIPPEELTEAKARLGL